MFSMIFQLFPMVSHGFPHRHRARLEQPRTAPRRGGRLCGGLRKEAQLAAVARLPVVEVQQNGHTS